jgi:hypothetical protein
VTHVDVEFSDQITLQSRLPEPLAHRGQITLISSNGSTVRTKDFGVDPLPTADFGPAPVPRMPSYDEATDPSNPLDTLTERRVARGLCVVLLQGVFSKVAREVFPLEFDEPLDIDGRGFLHKGTFTATPRGLRLDRLGGIRTVYAALDGRVPWLRPRARRYEGQLGTFQAIRVGEVLPVGSFAFVDHAFIRIDEV